MCLCVSDTLFGWLRRLAGLLWPPVRPQPRRRRRSVSAGRGSSSTSWERSSSSQYVTGRRGVPTAGRERRGSSAGVPVSPSVAPPAPDGRRIHWVPGVPPDQTHSLATFSVPGRLRVQTRSGFRVAAAVPPVGMHRVESHLAPRMWPRLCVLVIPRAARRPLGPRPSRPADVSGGKPRRLRAPT